LTFAHERVGASGPPRPGAKPRQNHDPEKWFSQKIMLHSINFERDDDSKKSHIEIAAPSFSNSPSTAVLAAVEMNPAVSLPSTHFRARSSGWRAMDSCHCFFALVIEGLVTTGKARRTRNVPPAL
jgi:hypothetical protein